MILGIKDGVSEVQSVRAKADKMTPSAFRQWLKDNDFEHGDIEEATQKSFQGFARWVPLSLDTLSKAEGDDEPESVAIGGICSTDDLDFEGESIAQDGLDWSYFLQHGWFNHEHEQGPSAVLGHPVKIEPVDERRTRVEGVLYLAKDLGRRIYETALALKKAAAPRSLGFSIEGQVVKGSRSGHKIRKAKVYSIAISPVPKNPDTWCDLAASMFSRTTVVEKAARNAILNPNMNRTGTQLNLEQATTRLLKEFPDLNWTQATKLAKAILAS